MPDDRPDWTAIMLIGAGLLVLGLALILVGFP